MSKRKKNYKKKGNIIKDLTKKILKILNQSPKNAFNYRQISSKLGIKDADGRNQIIKKLAILHGDG